MAETKMIGVRLKTRMFADQRGELEAIEVRHRDVDQDDCDVWLSADAKRLAPDAA